MRAALLLVALAACTEDPRLEIIAPLPDTQVVAVVELRMQGHDLTGVTETRVYVDLEQVTGELIDNDLPAECDGTCMFVISFAGAAISNGKHSVAVYLYKGEEQLATDAISLVFNR